MAAATATGEGEATRQKRKKKPKPNHEDLGVAPSQSPHASKPLPSAPSLQTPTQSPAPGTPILEEAAAEAAMRKRKMRKEQKLAVLPLAQNPTLEEGDHGVDAVLATTTTKKKHKERKPSPSPSAAAAAETPILELEAKVTKKRKPRKEQEPPGNSPLPVDPGQTKPRGTKAPHVSKLLPAAPFLEAPAQSPAPGTSMLEEAAAEAAMRKRKMHKEQKVVALPLAQNPTLEEPAEERVLATTKKKKHKERNKLSLSPSATAAAETPILEQDAKVTKKRKRSKEQEPSGYSALPLDPGQTQLHGTNAPHASKPLSAAPFNEAPAQSPAPGTPMLEGEAAAVTRKRKICKEQKVAALSLAENTTLEERREDAMTAKMKESKHMEHTLSCPSTSVASKTTIWEQEAKVNKKQKQRKQEEPSGESSLPLDPGQTQPQGTHAPPLPAVPFLEAPAQSPAPEIPTLEEAAAAVMRKRKICKEQKVAALSLAQNTTLEEQREDSMMAKNKESKHMKHTISSPSTSVAAKTTIWEQEAKVNKKQKQRKQQALSGESPLPLDPGQTQPQGTNAPHAFKPLPAVLFLEASAQSPAPEIPTLEEAAAAVMRKRKICKEQKVAALSLVRNTTLEEQREDAMMVKNKESKHMKHTISSPSTSVAAETTIWEQEVKVTKKQKQRKQEEPSGKSPLPLNPGQAHCVQSQGGKAPPEQEREADGRTGSSIKKNNGKRPRVRVLSKRELIKEASKKQPALPEGFVAFSDFVSSCTEQNPDHPSPYSAFFDQFRYNPVRGDHKPPLPRTPDRLARLPPWDHSSFGSSQLTANETSRASKSNTSVASKTKQLDSGSGSQEILNVEVKENPQKKMREKKQRKPSGNWLPFDPSQTCCGQLQGTKAPPEQYQEADAPKVGNIKNSNGKKARVCAPSKRELFKEMCKEQMRPEGFLAHSDFVPSCTVQNPNYSSPSGASFDQFCYRPACQDHNPQPPGTTDRLSMLPPRGYPSFELSELSANGTSKANNSVARKSKKKDSGSGSAPGSQDKLHAKEKKSPENKMKAKKPLLTRAEKSSDKYRRVPLDQLVPPPRSPHNLLQEKYASDPWKVIVICMLLNLTQGKQVKNIIEGFFECYPDPQSACNADPDKMAGYLAYLGLQRVKTLRIQRFSKEYVEKEWTYITELCGVGKYAADAYAIFCAGRATEVVPQDHKLVDYWKYVCFELPMMQ